MHLVIVRPLGNVLDVNSYNCQESDWQKHWLMMGGVFL